MGWSGRAPALPATNLARGAKDKEHPMSHNLNSTITVIGINIGKNSFHVVGLDERGGIVLRQKWSRSQVEARLANMPSCLIGMEACVGAHHLSRKLKAFGHDARLMPAKYVRPYSKGQKNDFRDAEAIAARRGMAFSLVIDRLSRFLMISAPGYFHLHLISDSTGETLITVARAAAAQYSRIMPVEHVH